MKKDKVLVTGALGFVGSNLVDFLVSKGYEVIGMDNLLYGTLENKNEKATYYLCDVNEIQHYFSKLKDVKVIYHLAAVSRIQPSFEEPVMTMKYNVMGTTEVCDVARKLGAKVVYAGSSTAFDDCKINPYAFAKFTGEEVCRLYSQVYGLSTAVARFFNVYDDGSRNPEIGDFSPVVGKWMRQFLAGEKLTMVEDGEEKFRDFTHVNDIIDALYEMSKGIWKGEVFQLGSGENCNLLELALCFVENKEQINIVPKRKGEAQRTLADIQLTGTMINWSPKVKVLDYLRNWKKENEKNAKKN
jgi:UDP-glucose 4-epimerase